MRRRFRPQREYISALMFLTRRHKLSSVLLYAMPPYAGCHTKDGQCRAISRRMASTSSSLKDLQGQEEVADDCHLSQLHAPQT